MDREDACRAYVARRVISLIDATDLADGSTEQSVTELCTEALKGPHMAAAVCVWPRFVKFIKKELPALLPEAKSLTVATVVNFPSGKGSAEEVKAEALLAVSDGADELDLVIDWELLNQDAKAGEEAIRALVTTVRQVSLGTTLKVILETGMIRSPNLIMLASMAALESGADMLKTSTGKVATNATLPAVRTMCQAIHKYRSLDSEGKVIGIKVAGGVKSLEVAAEYLNAVTDLMGADFPSKSTFRIGASSLLAVARGYAA